jgi:hypothetical protein
MPLCPALCLIKTHTWQDLVVDVGCNLHREQDPLGETQVAAVMVVCGCYVKLERT